MAGRPKKKNPNTKESMETLIIKAVKLYEIPYDDRKGERKPELPEYIAHMDDSSDNFEDEELRMMWNTLHQPVENFYSHLSTRGYLG